MNPTDSIFDLPDWVAEFRPSQERAASEVTVSILGGNEVTFLDAPTGAGKTLIGEMVRHMVGVQRCLYVCSSKTLQDQFLADYPYGALIKGRANFPTEYFPGRFPLINASMCTRSKGNPRCDLCSEVGSCPYQSAKSDALDSPLVVANTSYLLYEANYVGRFSEHFDLVILDEADHLEAELMNFVKLSIPARRVKELGLQPPKKVTVVDSWIRWVQEEALPIADEFARKATKAKHILSTRHGPTSVKALKAQMNERYAWDLRDRLENLATSLESEEWVYTGDRGNIEFKPVEVRPYAYQSLWRHAPQFLLMSATIISPHQMVHDLGVGERWGSVVVPSDFPPDRRPIYVDPVVSMTYKTREEAWPQMLDAVQAAVHHHPDVRILIHTVSYPFTKYLSERLQDPQNRVVSYSSADTRADALAAYKRSETAVMLAPSFDRGVSLDDDLCRVVVIPKIPFPSLGDRQVNQRAFGRGEAGKTWYATETVRSLVQMCGRGMRHRDDSCDIYILDKQFVSNVWKNSKEFLPVWFKEALVWGGSGIPKPRN